jgi:hypothetical protein
MNRFHWDWLEVFDVRWNIAQPPGVELPLDYVKEVIHSAKSSCSKFISQEEPNHVVPTDRPTPQAIDE